MESRFVEAAGHRVHVRVADGAGPAAPAVVLVHGLIVSSRYMLPLARELAPDVRVYALDLPGYGLSARPPRALDTGELAEALGATVAALALDAPVLVGNSFGCQVVAELAATAPAAACGCVLVSPTYDPGVSRLECAVRWSLNLFVERPSLLAVVARDLADVGLRRAAATAAQSVRHEIERRLPLVAAPTLVVRGTRDPAVPGRWAGEAARLLPAGRLAVLDGPHALNYSRPRELANLVRAFLSEL